MALNIKLRFHNSVYNGRKKYIFWCFCDIVFNVVTKTLIVTTNIIFHFVIHYKQKQIGSTTQLLNIELTRRKKIVTDKTHDTILQH